MEPFFIRTHPIIRTSSNIYLMNRSMKTVSKGEIDANVMI
jgi:hypothetical protein